jgi:hypothetical protein
MGSLLMSGLGARRDRIRKTGTRAGGAIADRKYIGISRCLKGLLHHKLVGPVCLKTTEVFQEVRPFHPGGPHHKRCGDNIATCQPDPLGRDFADPGACFTSTPIFFSSCNAAEDTLSGRAGKYAARLREG